MPNWYHPGLPPTAIDAALLAKWASDEGIAAEHLILLTNIERESAIEALRSLAYWWATPIKSDPENPFWMEDEGYSDSDKDTRLLNELAQGLRSRCRPYV